MTTASTIRGTVTVEPDVALSDLNVGDLVLGTPDSDTAPLRTLHRVVTAFGKHRIPPEAPSTRLERFVLRLERGELGVVVERISDQPSGEPDLAMFVADHTPTLDRVIDGEH